MTDPTRQNRRGSTAATRSAMGVADEDRLAELDARLARLERTPGLRERSRTLMDRVMPPEANEHFRNAGREQLMGIRSIVDYWIRRLDEAEARAGRRDRERETIKID